MRKIINNKGLTAVELIVAFALVSIITISMFSVVNRYRSKENLESFKNSVTTYKNTLTRAIYDDIILNKGISTIEKNEETDYVDYNLALANNNTSKIRIYNKSMCYNKSIGQKPVYNQPCTDSNNLNIDYKNSDYHVEYTPAGSSIAEKFELPKIQGLRFNEIQVESKENGFVLIHIGLYHNDYGTKYNALNILVPSSNVYPGKF